MKQAESVVRICRVAGLLAWVVFSACAAVADAGSKIYYIRHGETMGNVTGDYSEENQCTFSPKGLEQVAAVPEVLAPYSFDVIAVSPTWRTRQTVLPYLKAFERKGVIWPEIEEGGCDLRGGVAAENIPQGQRIEITPEEETWFELRDADSEYRFAPTSNPESLAIFERGIRMLKEQFGGTGKSVLLVSHSCTGSRYFELLLGLEARGRFAPQNATVSLFEEQPDGAYRMARYNGHPFVQRYRWEMSAQDYRDLQTGPLELVLRGEYFGPVPQEGYHLTWELTNHDHTSKQGGDEVFPMMENTESALHTLLIRPDELQPGENMVMKTTLYDGDALVQEWEQILHIPDTLNLAGEWKIKQGENSARSEPDYDDQVWYPTQVPGPWEHDALPNYDGTAWYRYRFTVPAECAELWGDQALALYMGAIDDADVTWFDGKEIGASGRFPPEKITAYDSPRIYPIPSSLTAGSEHVLAVCVSDWMGAGGIWKGPVLIGPEKSLRSLQTK